MEGLMMNYPLTVPSILDHGYRVFPKKEIFFDASQSKQIGNFDKLAGSSTLRKQIIAGIPEQEIRASWEPALSLFKSKRSKYLLYP